METVGVLTKLAPGQSAELTETWDLFTGVPEVKSEADVDKHVLPLVEAGQVKVPVHSTFPIEQAAEAYDAFAAGGKLGKIVLLMG